jgi:hypothetical protein
MIWYLSIAICPLFGVFYSQSISLRYHHPFFRFVAGDALNKELSTNLRCRSYHWFYRGRYGLRLPTIHPAIFDHILPIGTPSRLFFQIHVVLHD